MGFCSLNRGLGRVILFGGNAFNDGRWTDRGAWPFEGSFWTTQATRPPIFLTRGMACLCSTTSHCRRGGEKPVTAAGEINPSPDVCATSQGNHGSNAFGSRPAGWNF